MLCTHAYRLENPSIKRTVIQNWHDNVTELGINGYKETKQEQEFTNGAGAQLQSTVLFVAGAAKWKFNFPSK
jgi:hypothetical protein